MAPVSGVDNLMSMMRRPPMPAQTPPLGQQVLFSDAQQEALAEALFHAEVALLDSMVAEAKRADAFDGPRKVGQLAQALSLLRCTAGQQPVQGPMMGPWGAPFGAMMQSFGPTDYDDLDDGPDNE